MLYIWGKKLVTLKSLHTAGSMKWDAGSSSMIGLTVFAEASIDLKDEHSITRHLYTVIQIT